MENKTIELTPEEARELYIAISIRIGFMTERKTHPSECGWDVRCPDRVSDKH